MLAGMTLGVIGVGNMGEALVRGVLAGGGRPTVVVFDHRAHVIERLTRELDVVAAKDNAALVAQSDLILLAVKPQVLRPVLAEVGGQLRSTQVLVSIAAGVTIASLEAGCTEAVPVVRVMPNTPALVGEGASGYALGRHATARHGELVGALLGSVGLAVEVPEDQIDALTALSGSGPAYVFRFMEALLEGADAVGLPRELALPLARQTLLGAARMVIETGEEPAELRRKVTSPGGMTQAALAVMDEADLVGVVRRAMVAARDRGVELGRLSAEADAS